MFYKAKIIVNLFLFLSTFILSSILSFSDKPIPGQEEFLYADDTGATEEGIKQIITANNNLAIEIYKELVQETGEKNLFFSPFGILIGLAMLYEGAGGKTEEEIKITCHFPEKEITRANIACIYNMINGSPVNDRKKEKLNNIREETKRNDISLLEERLLENQENKTVGNEVNICNGIWVQEGINLLQPYEDTIKKFFLGIVKNVDFESEPDISVQIINDYIEKKTKGTIKKFLSVNMLPDPTFIILTNSVYFKGGWFYEFDSKKTQERDFYISNTEIVKVPFMHFYPDGIKFYYADLEEFSILELPYKKKEMSMFILLPKKDLSALETTLSLNTLNQSIKSMTPTKLDTIAIPKFEMNCKYDLDNSFRKLGLTSIYDDATADFSNLCTAHIWLAKSVNMTYIKVDETGTLGASALGMLMTLGKDSQVINFIAYRPFIYLIRHNETGLILFMGRLTNPLVTQ